MASESDAVKLADLKVGDKLITTLDFDCLDAGKQVEITSDGHGRLYVDCSIGTHYLQELNDGTVFGFKRAAS